MLIIPLININIILYVHNHNFFCSPKYGHVSQRYVGSIVASEILKPVIKEGKSKDTFCHSSQIYIYIYIYIIGKVHIAKSYYSLMSSWSHFRTQLCFLIHACLLEFEGINVSISIIFWIKFCYKQTLRINFR